MLREPNGNCWSRMPASALTVLTVRYVPDACRCLAAAGPPVLTAVPEEDTVDSALAKETSRDLSLRTVAASIASTAMASLRSRDRTINFAASQ